MMNRYLLYFLLLGIGSTAQADRFSLLKVSDLSKVVHHIIAIDEEVEALAKEFTAEGRLYSRVYREAKAAWEKEHPDFSFPRYSQRKYSTPGTYATLEEAEDRLKRQRLKDSIDRRKRDQIRARLPTRRDERTMLEEAALGHMETFLTAAMKKEGFERSLFSSPRGPQGRGKPLKGHMEFDVAGTLRKSSSGEYYLVPSNKEQEYDLPPWEMDISRSVAEGLGIQTMVDRKVVITFSAELHGHSGGTIRFLAIQPIAVELDH